MIQRCIEESGLRYTTQSRFGTYDVDFYLPEIEVVIEADGPFGHLSKRDKLRDDSLLDMGVAEVWHFRENTLKTIKDRLWQELNRLENNQ